ncbi:hypothetical protein LRP88_11569 [Fusarium phalaenopsidis]
MSIASRVKRPKIKHFLFSFLALAVTVKALPHAEAEDFSLEARKDTLVERGGCGCGPDANEKYGGCVCKDSKANRDDSKKRCICLYGLILVHNECSCPSGRSLKDGKCVCPKGKVWNKWQRKRQCPKGQVEKHSKHKCQSDCGHEGEWKNRGCACKKNGQEFNKCSCKSSMTG